MLLIKVNRKTDAFIAVDIQPTFMPGGGLAVEGGDEIVPIVRQLMGMFDKCFATLDRHSLGHISFASSYQGIDPMHLLTHEQVSKWNGGEIAALRFGLGALKDYLYHVSSQVLWPDHAIEGTAEAELHSEFSEDEFAFVQVKGTDPVCDSYSGFYDNLGRSTGFDSIVAGVGVKRLFICGLAFDFCVGWTALDALKALPNTEVYIIEDACRSVNAPGTVDKMTQDFADAGIQIIQSSQLVV